MFEKLRQGNIFLKRLLLFILIVFKRNEDNSFLLWKLIFATILAAFRKFIAGLQKFRRKVSRKEINPGSQFYSLLFSFNRFPIIRVRWFSWVNPSEVGILKFFTMKSSRCAEIFRCWLVYASPICYFSTGVWIFSGSSAGKPFWW